MRLCRSIQVMISLRALVMVGENAPLLVEVSGGDPGVSGCGVIVLGGSGSFWVDLCA